MSGPTLRRVGDGAVGASHTSMKSTVTRNFDWFLAEHGEDAVLQITAKKFVDCTAQDLGKLVLYQLFAHFLFTTPKLVKNKVTKQFEPGLSYKSVGTIIDYFNCAVQLARAKAPDEKVFENYLLPNSESDTNFKKIRNELTNMCIRRLFNEGRSLGENKSSSLERVQAMSVSMALMFRGSVRDYEDRGASVCNWATAGRAGEGAFFSWDLLEWSWSTCNLRGTWAQHKTAHDKIVAFAADSEHYAIDFYHSLACYRLTGNGNRLDHCSNQTSTSVWIYKHLAYDSNPSVHMTKAIKNVSVYHNRDKFDTASVEEKKKYADKIITKDVTATSYRIGSQNHIIAHPDCSHKHVVCVSGHNMTGVCAMWEYLICQFLLCVEAARALAGWKNIKANTGQAPTLDCVVHQLDDPTRKSLFCYLKALFLVEGRSPLDENEPLWPLTQTLGASLFMYLQDMINDLGSKDIVVVTMITVGKQYGLRLPILLDWGLTIRADWVRRNAAAQAEVATDLQQCLTLLQSMDRRLEGLQVMDF